MIDKNMVDNYEVRNTPEGHLWCAVIERALVDASYEPETKITSRININKMHEKYQAIYWIWCRKRSSQNDFENVCKNIDINPDGIRQFLSKEIKDIQIRQNDPKVRHLIRYYGI